MTARTSSGRCSIVGRFLSSTLRQAGATLVEDDETRESRQPLEEAREQRLGPELFDVRDLIHDEHQIDRPVADHLIGDVT
jgi:hypothetical protein